jgi:hypothetical protein
MPDEIDKEQINDLVAGRLEFASKYDSLADQLFELALQALYSADAARAAGQADEAREFEAQASDIEARAVDAHSQAQRMRGQHAEWAQEFTYNLRVKDVLERRLALLRRGEPDDPRLMEATEILMRELRSKDSGADPGR